jgi:hypothetical protein
MNKLLLTALAITLINCTPDSSEYEGPDKCYYNGYLIYVQQHGVCYYYNDSGTKTYLDQSICVGCLP